MKSIHDKDAKKTADSYGRDPFSVVIIGLDTNDGPEHSLCDKASNDYPLTEAGVNYAYTFGIDETVLLVRDGERVLVFKGRKKTKELREANLRRVRDGLPPHLLPTIVVKGSHEAPGMRRRRAIENWGLRRDIPPSVIAREAQELLEHDEITEELLCELLQIRKGQLKNYLALPALGARATAALDSGTLTLSSALPLTKLSVADQNSALAKLPQGGKKPTLDRVREAMGKAPIQTPKVRLGMAAEMLEGLDEAALDRESLEKLVSALKGILIGKPKELAASAASQEKSA